MRLVTSKSRAIHKYLETLSGYSILVQFEAQQRGLQFYQTRSNAVILYDTLLAEFIEKAICMKTKDPLYQRESVILRPRVVLKLIRKVVHKIYLYKKQDHLGNRNKMRRATGEPEATLLTTEYLVFRFQR